MNKDIVRERLEKIKGVNNHFRFNGSRNRIEEFDGVVRHLYPAIFIIEDYDNNTRAFSYNDVITSSLEITLIKK